MFGHQLRVSFGGFVRDGGKTLLGGLELMRDHKMRITQSVQSVQKFFLPHLKLVPRAQHGQFGDMKEMSVIAEHSRADVKRAACDQ